MLSVSVPARGSAQHNVEVGAPDADAIQVLAYSIVVAGGASLEATVTWHPSAAASTPVLVLPRIRVTSEEDVIFAARGAGELRFAFKNAHLLSSRSVALTISKESAAAAEARGRLSSAIGLDAASDMAALNRLALHGVRLFFINEFDKAEAFFATERLRVPVFAISHATLSWLRALMTWDSAAIAETRKRLAAAQAVTAAFMPPDTLAAGLAAGLAAAAGSSSAPLSGVALEATLIHAEAMLLGALLALMEESLLSLARCALAIRAGWRLYGVVDTAVGGRVMRIASSPALAPGAAIALRDVAPVAATLGTGATVMEGIEGDDLMGDVEQGIAFGIGGFNSVASLLPPIILRILSAVGLPFSRDAGLAQLREAMTGGRVRAPLAGLLLLGMRVLVPSFHTGGILAHAPEAGAVLHALLTAFPNSALPLWMGGRLHRMQARLDDAAAAFKSCASAAGGSLQQLQDLATYELAWCEAFRGDWGAAAPLHAVLREKNNWSKAYYSYSLAVSLLEQGHLGDAREAFAAVLTLSSRRLGGRVIPAEQFAVKRAAEYLALTLPPRGRVGGGELPPPPGYKPRHIPAFVAPGSPAHAAALAFPGLAPGLESIYYFGGFSQMTPDALTAALVQVDALLGAVCRGEAFSGDAPLWAAGAAGEGASAAVPFDAARAGTAFRVGMSDAAGAATAPTPAPPLSPAALTALLDAAASAASALGGDAAPTAPPARSTFSLFRAAASAAGAAIGAGASAVVSVGSAIGAVATGGSGLSAPPPPRPFAPLPTNAVALAALVRGAICGVLGRGDEASAALAWINRSAGDGSPAAAALLARDAGLVAYASYEEALLALDVLGARRGSPPGADWSGASTRERETLSGDAPRALAGALASSLPTAAAAARAATPLLARARRVAVDFPWRVRLHIRIHLASCEVREALRGEGVVGGGAEGEGEEGEEEGEGGPAAAAVAEELAALAGGEGERGEEEERERV